MPPPPLPMIDAGVRFGDAQPGVGPRLARGDDADQRRPRVALRIGARLASQMSSPSSAGTSSIVTAGTGAATRQGNRGVELGDRARAAAAAAHVVPEALATDTERRDDADAGDDDARRVVMLSHYNTVAESRPLGRSARCSSGSAARCSSARSAYCALVVLRRSATPRPGMGRRLAPRSDRSALFSVFALHHSVFARERRQARGSTRPSAASASVGLRLDRQPAADRVCARWAPIGRRGSTATPAGRRFRTAAVSAAASG